MSDANRLHIFLQCQCQSLTFTRCLQAIAKTLGIIVEMKKLNPLDRAACLKAPTARLTGKEGPARGRPGGIVANLAGELSPAGGLSRMVHDAIPLPLNVYYEMRD